MAILDGTSPTGAWSMYRDLLTSFIGGQRYTTATGVNQITDQTGNAHHFTMVTGSQQPVVATAGPNSKTCADFDGVDDFLSSAAMSTFITASSAYIVATFILDAASTTNNAITYNNQCVFEDSAAYTGVFLKSDNSIYAMNYTTADTHVSSSITVGTMYVVEWRNDSGNLYMRLNGGTEFSIASGNTGALTGTFQLAASSAGKTNMKIFELASWSTVPAQATRDSIAANFQAQSINTTFNPADLSGVTLSGGNLIATAAGPGVGAVRGVDEQISGKFYIEYTFNALNTWMISVGIASRAAPLTASSAGGNAGPAVTFASSNGGFCVNLLWAPGNGVAVAAGNTVCLAIDITNRLWWQRIGAAGTWNNNASANPATGFGGLSFPLAPVNWAPFVGFSGAPTGNQVTANFGDSAFVGAVPSGFTAGWPASGIFPNIAASTQTALEEWALPNPQAQVTQATLEEWGSTAVVVPPTGGFVGFDVTARSSAGFGAGALYLTKLTAQQNAVANAMLIDVPGAVGGLNFRALVYDGAHSALLAQSAIVTSLVSNYNRMPLSAPLTLNAGTDYWVGYVCDTNFNITYQAGGGTSWFVSSGMNPSSPPNPLATGASNTNALMIALELDAAGALPYAWATDRANTVALSGSNRIATFPASANLGARSVVDHYPSNEGKWYAEVDVGGSVATSSNQIGIGLAPICWGVTQPPLAIASNLAYTAMLLATGTISNGGASVGLSYQAGDTVQIAYDAINNLLWFSKNNSGSWYGASSTAGNPSTASGGAAVSAAWPYAAVAASGMTLAATFTLRDTQDALRYTPPSGYSPWSSYVLPTYIPPPPSAPAKGADKGKGKGPQGKVGRGPPALRQEGLDVFLEPFRRKRAHAPWALQPPSGPALGESATAVTSISATVAFSAALTASAATASATASGRLLAATLSESVGATAALAATNRALGALAASALGTDASSATMVTHAALTASSATSDVPYHGVTFPGLLSEGAATSAAITALMATHAALTEGSATNSLVAGFRTLQTALSESGVGSAALAAKRVAVASLSEGAGAAASLSAMARLLASLSEGALGAEDAAAVAILRAALGEAAGTLDADTYLATTHPLRRVARIIGEQETPDIRGEWFEPPEAP